MKGIVLDYTGSEMFVLLDNDSIINLPINLSGTTLPIGSNINLGELYNSTYASHSNHYKSKNNLLNSI